MKRETALKILEDIKQSYDLIAEDFSRTRKNVWEEFRPLADDIQDGDKILDLGCGNGRFVELFSDPDKYGASKKIDYVGIDISEKLIEIAKQRYPDKNFQVFDGLKIPFNDQSFDKVFCIAVLHHIPGADLRNKFLKEIWRVLKPDGKLVLSAWYLWQKDTFWQLLFKFTFKKIIGRSELDFFDIMEPWGKISERYFHNFRKRELENLIEGAGFYVEKIGILKRGEKNKNLLVIAKK